MPDSSMQPAGEVTVRLPPAVAVPPHSYSQREIAEGLGYSRERALRIFDNAGLQSRRFCVEGDGFTPDETPQQLAERFAEWAPRLSAEALRGLLETHSLEPEALRGLVAVTSTGELCPGLSTRLMHRLDLSEGLHGLDVVGHGCAGGMTGLRAAVGMVAATGGPVALCCVEICSACYTVDDSFETLVANAICADGASAVLMDSAEQSHGTGQNSFRPVQFGRRTESRKHNLVGFQQRDGRRVVQMGSELREDGPELLLSTAEELLEKSTAEPEDVGPWLLHPGGPAIVDRVRKASGLDEHWLRTTLEVYSEWGNMSSPTVWFVVREAARSGRLTPGTQLLMGALGPGLSAELALARVGGE